MADAGFFKGTSADQDRRFSDKELKLLKSMKFPPEFDKKVDMRKVNLSVIRPWIVKKVVELVGFEDEVVVEYAMGLLEDDSQPTPDPRKMQINLTGFLTGSTPAFMTALWNLLLEAQDSPAGVPRTFVEEKKEEMRQARAGDTRAIEERDRRARLDEIRAAEPWRWTSTLTSSPVTPTKKTSLVLPHPCLQHTQLALSFSHSSPPPLPTPTWWQVNFPHSPTPISSTPQTFPPTSLAIPLSLSPAHSAAPTLSLNHPSSKHAWRPPSPRSPPPYRGGGYGRRRSPSRSRSLPRRRRRSPSVGRDRSPPPRRRSPPRRKGGRSPSRESNRSRTLDTARGSTTKMDVDKADGKDKDKNKDKDKDKDKDGELKIRGQADVGRRKTDKERMDVDSEVGKEELEKRESELKEKALRNKVVRTRKTSTANGAGPSSSAGN
ncbi:hypothetical protein V8D89_002706 [Ganoderma adspersum]